MLKRLEVQNYAIIDQMTIDFAGKMNIITGETGAGKSIVMGALSLILGDRADTTVLLNREKKCFVEGTFTLNTSAPLRQILIQHDLEGDDEIVVRREISATGKSRAFVNDTPVNLELLRTLTAHLVDLHRQFDTLELGQSEFQRQVVDALSGSLEMVAAYQLLYNQWKDQLRLLETLQQQKNQFAKEFDYHKFLYDELEQAAFSEDEIEEAESSLKLISNAEGIKSLLARLTEELAEGDSPIVHQLKSLSNQVHAVGQLHKGLADLGNRLSSVQIELQDIADDVDRINQDVNYDPAKAEALNERISTGYRLLKKHGLKTTRELLELQASLDDKLKAVLNIDEELLVLENKVKQIRFEAEESANAISLKRKQFKASLEEKVNKLLIQVGMPNARIRVDVSDTPLSLYGKDAIEFLFDANKSNRFEPLRKVASGGELSRLMLSIKSLVAESIDLPTMIFDEIDSGISGEAAKQVGIIMKKLSNKRQLIAITHQPQIAGKADAHYFIYKEIQNDALKTNIRLLNTEERITAIAKMLSGERPTAAALENAREMVRN